MVLKSLEKAVAEVERVLEKERKKAHTYIDNIFTDSDAKEILNFCRYILDYNPNPIDVEKTHTQYSPKEVAELRKSIYFAVQGYRKGDEFTTEDVKKKLGLRSKYSKKRIAGVLNKYDSVKYTGVSKRTWIKK